MKRELIRTHGTDAMRKRDTSVSPTFHKGQLIDAKHLLEDFMKTHVGTAPLIFEILDLIEESARENSQGCDWSHDLMLKDYKVTPEGHLEQCGCDCDFCETEHETRVGANTRKS